MKRILVVGGGLIGIRHLRAVQAHEACTLVGLADPDLSIAPDVPRFASMVDVDLPVDGVIIATPTHLHAEHGAYAAKQGWHMLIEKPVAATLAEAETLETALRDTGTRSLVGHHRRYHACVEQLRTLIAEGKIGDVVNVSLLWAMRKPDEYFKGNWRTAGGSPVMINLVHDIDLLRFTIGEISQALALGGSPLRGADRIESGAIALRFESGATGTISFADTAATPWGFEAGTGENPNIGTTGEDMMWITGTKGAVSFPSMSVWSGTDWSTAAHRIPHTLALNNTSPLDAQLTHFIDVIGGTAPRVDVADATRTLAVAQDIETQLTQTSTIQHKTA